METKRETEGPWRPDLWPKSVPNRETRHAKVERKKKTNKLQLKEDDGARQLEQQTASRRRQLLVL